MGESVVVSGSPMEKSGRKDSAMLSSQDECSDATPAWQGFHRVRAGCLREPMPL
jgi:hypothetical protein